MMERFNKVNLAVYGLGLVNPFGTCVYNLAGGFFLKVNAIKRNHQINFRVVFYAFLDFNYFYAHQSRGDYKYSIDQILFALKDSDYKVIDFQKSRLATIDISHFGRSKHHIAGMVEIDVTDTREKLKIYKNRISKISFTAWLIKTIGLTINDHQLAAGFYKGKRKIQIFSDVNVSMVVEKTINGQRVPIPVIITKANERSIESITMQIAEARSTVLTVKDIVLQKKSSRLESLYYILPGSFRRMFWRYLLRHPKLAYQKMGNVAFTSVGMMGQISGWFIPISVHPICFGIGSIVKKPVVVESQIVIREILHLTVLLDHDVIDGAHMARFISDLNKNLAKGITL